MFDNTIELLGSTWQEAWHICEGYQRNLEGITEPYESGSLDWSVDIQAAGKHLRLICNYTDDTTFYLSKPSDDVFGIAGHNLVEFVPVCDIVNDVKHIVWLVGVLRDNVV